MLLAQGMEPVLVQDMVDIQFLFPVQGKQDTAVVLVAEDSQDKQGKALEQAVVLALEPVEVKEMVLD